MSAILSTLCLDFVFVERNRKWDLCPDPRSHSFWVLFPWSHLFVGLLQVRSVQQVAVTQHSHGYCCFLLSEHRDLLKGHQMSSSTRHPLASCFQSPPFSFLAGCLLIYSLISIWRKLWEWMHQLERVQWDSPDNSSPSTRCKRNKVCKLLHIM